MKKDSFPKTVRGYYWLCLRKFPWFIGTVFACTVIGHALEMVFSPLITKWMVEIFENAVDKNFGDIIHLLCLMIVMISGVPLLNTFSRYLIGAYQQKFNRYKLYLIYKRVYENDISFFLDKSSGQIMSDCQAAYDNLHSLTDGFFGKMIGILLGFALIIGSMFTMNIWFVITLLAYGVIKLGWEWSWNPKIVKKEKEEMKEWSVYRGLRSDSLNNALAVKYFANNKFENGYLYHGRDKLIELVRTRYFLERWKDFPMDLLWAGVRIFLLILCFVFIKDGTINLSDGVFVMTSAAAINGAFSSLNRTIQDYTRNLARATTAYDNIIVPINIQDKENAKNLKIKKATVDFDNVSFSYGDNHVFHNFNLHIDNAEKIGIVGLSGAGKTTLCNLLLRMYDVESGSIMVGDTDIRDVTQESLRKSISFVPQEANMFNRTIYENIKYAKPNATRAEVINAAKKAHIHEFIVKLPRGYNTLVGNNGIKLSGGQRQRVSIARALLKNAPILMLDEATSALDSQNEVMIQKSLANAMHGKTTLVIAHRLSTLRNMDKIIVIKNGKIVESGNHKQLLRKDGEYKKLWNLQTSGFVS